MRATSAILTRDRGRLTGSIIGALVVFVIAGCFATYGIQARQARDAFDEALTQRALDVVAVVLREDGTVDLTALRYAGDLDTLGIDVYLFSPKGDPLFAPPPARRRVAGLPAAIPLRGAVAGGEEDIRTIPLPGAGTRVLTYPVWAGEGDNAQVALIVQVGRPETALVAALARLRALAAAGGAALLLAAIGGGLLIVRQAMVPVRRSLAQQQAFVANAAHELRTPLSVIQAAAELALLRPRPAPEYMAALAEIAGAATQTSALVDDLLALARFDAGREPPPQTPVDLAAIAKSVVAETAADPDHPITVRAEGECVVRGDATLLRRLVGNLVDNACRHTPAGTAVRLTLVRERSWLVLRVSDTGPGIPAAELPHLFERFYRGRGGQEGGRRGAGLGLSLARQIAVAHDGRVELTSRAGAGTTATVSLPLAARAAAPDRPSLA